ncbi:MAG: BsuBI/PstI family type II restriction endonuclease [Hormoscilla sp.]
MSGQQISDKTVQKIEEAKYILKALGLPEQQQNDRSALTLLALLALKSDSFWSQASNPLMGITPIMQFIKQNYGREYAPNTRETIRRHTVHQFLDAGIIKINPDKPTRPTNSPNTVYSVDESVLNLLRIYGTEAWMPKLKTYLSSIETLKKRYARDREMKRIPVTLASGETISLSPGGQNQLLKHIIEDFCELFTPGGKVILIGDADKKWQLGNQEYLENLGVNFNTYGKMPDVAVHYLKRNWLVLIEAVTSHGPVDAKRRNELEAVFKNSTAGLVFVTAFLTRSDMAKYIHQISWETEVWVAEEPTHMIHFNGERFLGPY